MYDIYKKYANAILNVQCTHMHEIKVEQTRFTFYVIRLVEFNFVFIDYDFIQWQTSETVIVLMTRLILILAHYEVPIRQIIMIDLFLILFIKFF